MGPRPNDVADYEEPTPSSSHYEEPLPPVERDEDLASIEYNHGLEAGQLQFRGDFGTGHLDETELERVDVVNDSMASGEASA